LFYLLWILIVARVAALQMTSSFMVEDNLRGLEAFFSQAREGGAALLVLPENFAFMGREAKDKQAIAEELGHGVIQDAVSVLAKRYGLWVIAGSLFLSFSQNKVKASCLVYNEGGEQVARYDKIHLFDARVSEHEQHQESATIEAGNEAVVVDTPVGRVGLSVCYDLRFPELYRQLVLKGANVFTVPSAFTAITGEAHWDILLRARAIENLCYVVAPNQGGVHANGRHTYGHSMILDPWGKILSQQRNGSGVIFADIDLQHLNQLRRQFPCNDHHKLM